MQKYSKRRDLYCITDMNKHAVELPVALGLTDKEIIELFNTLKNEVVASYPNLQLNS